MEPQEWDSQCPHSFLHLGHLRGEKGGKGAQGTVTYTKRNHDHKGAAWTHSRELTARRPPKIVIISSTTHEGPRGGSGTERQTPTLAASCHTGISEQQRPPRRCWPSQTVPIHILNTLVARAPLRTTRAGVLTPLPLTWMARGRIPPNGSGTGCWTRQSPRCASR